ncbi:MAG: aspartate/glutamate racemase family protein [Proteobacteria bacterium]|nr:aspartate/glutamate racemase family protein [Pseudomonadota bacterium]MDA0928367.1 aspartate/glutamate racemase family protein [Pseudomonadota bacterium]
MKTMGLLGGMSWQSTNTYYSLLNQGIAAALGGLHSARLMLYSVDFDEIEKLQHAGKWEEMGELLAAGAQRIEAGGADFLMICTNTMHKVAPQVEAAITIPLLHLADATGQRLQDAGVTRAGLLGTRFTMEQDFYKQRIIDNFGIDVIVPEAGDIEIIHKVIYDELCLGIVRGESRATYLAVIDRLRANGAQAVILGCTEIAMLVKQEHTTMRLYDTTTIHCEEAVKLAIAD